MKTFDVVGQPVNRSDGYEKVTGRAKYVGDIKVPGMLYGKIFRSAKAHAVIKSLDTTKAKALDGVVAVVTYDDCPDIPFTTCGHPFPFDTPLDSRILNKHVRYVGDPIAAVAAVSKDIAERAVALIEAEYEELPAYFTPEDALKPDAYEIHEGLRNIAGENEFEIGNVDKAFSEAAYVFEDELEMPIVTHSPIEPHISLVEIDHNGRLTLHLSGQVPFIMRERLAYALGIKERDIRVIKGYVGGGFGGKQEPVHEQINCLLTMKTKKPVLLELTREECLATTRTRHAAKIKIRSALDKNYRFMARDIHVIHNTGAYSSHGHNVALNIATQCQVLYPVKNLRYEAKSVYTNILIAGAMRGYGMPQWTFAMESHVNNIAHRLHMNPLDFRNLNRFSKENPFDVQHLSMHTCGLNEAIEKGKAMIGWDSFKKEEQKDSKFKKGIGVALCTYGQSCYPHSVELSSARISMNEDGSATLFIGCAEIGQGTDTVMAQIAAETLGIPFEWIHIYAGDTDICPFDVGAYASRQTYVAGMAVKNAAMACKEDILNFAEEHYGIPAQALDVKKGVIIRKEDGSEVCPLETLMHKVIYNFPHADYISHTGYHTPVDNMDTFGACFAEVTVDTGTGQVEVDKLVTLLDSGRIINPQTAYGQLYGGSVMSYGYGLTEQILIDPKTGRVYNDNLLDYKVPTSADVPDISALFVETDEPTSAYGNKSLGEPPNLAPAAAIRNAVCDALDGKVFFNQIPLTPERVLMTIKEAEKSVS